MNEDVRSAYLTLTNRLAAAQSKRTDLETEMRDVEAEIANLKKAIHRVAVLLGSHHDEPISEMGITDAVRSVIGLQPISPTQVREELAKHGFDLGSYENPMASIYKILARLAEAGELEATKDGWNTFYRKKPNILLPRYKRRRLRRHFGDNKPVAEDT